MKSETKDYVLKWYQKAGEDLNAARKLFCISSEQFAETINFHLQQSTEKYLKAFLTANEQNFPKTHNHELLKKLCSIIDSKFEEFNFGALTQFATDYRYPDDIYEADLEEINEYFRLAEQIEFYVKQKVNFDI